MQRGRNRTARTKGASSCLSLPPQALKRCPLERREGLDLSGVRLLAKDKGELNREDVHGEKFILAVPVCFGRSGQRCTWL